MLARLEGIPALEDVGVDRSGTYLRLRAADEAGLDRCVDAVSVRLHEEGVFVERAADPPDIARWYGPDEVRELSQAEAAELARQAAAAVVPSLDVVAMDRVRELVARYLHAAFVTHHLERGERVPLDAAVERIRSEMSTSLSDEQTGSLVRALRTILDLPPR